MRVLLIAARLIALAAPPAGAQAQDVRSPGPDGARVDVDGDLLPDVSVTVEPRPSQSGAGWYVTTPTVTIRGQAGASSDAGWFVTTPTVTIRGEAGGG